MRPKFGTFKLSKAEQDCLTWIVLSGCTKEEAYALFCHPELRNSKKILKEYVKSFFASPITKEYIAAYKATLSGKSTIETSSENLNSEQIVDRFRGRVFDAMDKAEGLEELEMAAKLGDRVNVFDNGENKIEEPRRYLAETCSRCAYRIFVEKEIAAGNIEVENE